MRYRNEEQRNLLLATLVFDPRIKSELRKFLDLVKEDIHCDYMYIRFHEDGKYVSVNDPGVWVGRNGNIKYLLIRTPEGKWFLTGC